MRHYELMVILDPELEERTVTPSLETYLKIIKDSGGRVDKLDVWASAVCHLKSIRSQKAFTQL